MTNKNRISLSSVLNYFVSLRDKKREERKHPHHILGRLCIILSEFKKAKTVYFIMCISMNGPPNTGEGRRQSPNNDRSRNSTTASRGGGARGDELVPLDVSIEQLPLTRTQTTAADSPIRSDAVDSISNSRNSSQARGGWRNRRSVYKNHSSYKMSGRSKASKTRYLTRSELCGIGASILLSLSLCLLAMYLLHLSLPVVYRLLVDIFSGARSVIEGHEVASAHQHELF